MSEVSVDQKKDHGEGVDDVVDASINRGNHQQTSYTRISAKVLRKNYKKTEWLVDMIIPVGGVVVVAGMPGCGKSWLVLSMALAIARGENWIERFECRKGRVLICMEEDDPNSVLERLDLLYAGLSISKDEGDALEIEYLIQQGVKILTANSKNLNPNIAAQVREFKPDLVVFDPSRRFHELEENDSGSMSNLFRQLRKLTKQTDQPVAVLLTHHLNKGVERTQGMDRLRGSTDIAASADGILMVEKKIPTLKVSHEKNKRGPEQERFMIEVEVLDESVTLTYSDKSMEVEDKSKQETEVVTDVLKNGPLNQSTFWKDCNARGIGTDRAKRAAQKLKKEEKLKIDDGPGGSKMYSLTEPVVDEDIEPPTTNITQEELTKYLEMGKN